MGETVPEGGDFFPFRMMQVAEPSPEDRAQIEASLVEGGPIESALAQATAPRGGYGRQPGPKVASMDAAKKIPPQVKQQLAQMVGMVRQLGAGTKYASRAEEISLELGLEIPAAP